MAEVLPDIVYSTATGTELRLSLVLPGTMRTGRGPIAADRLRAGRLVLIYYHRPS